jgi:hypothetical protein
MRLISQYKEWKIFWDFNKQTYYVFRNDKYFGIKGYKFSDIASYVNWERN